MFVILLTSTWAFFDTHEIDTNRTSYGMLILDTTTRVVWDWVACSLRYRIMIFAFLDVFLFQKLSGQISSGLASL